MSETTNFYRSQMQGIVGDKSWIIAHALELGTGTLDLADLVDRRALLRSGERKATRYRLNIPTAT